MTEVLRETFRAVVAAMRAEARRLKGRGLVRLERALRRGPRRAANDNEAGFSAHGPRMRLV